MLFQVLNDVGFSIPAQAVTYWNGEAMHSVDYQDLDSTPEKTAATTKASATNAAHLAQLLAASQYPSRADPALLTLRTTASPAMSIANHHRELFVSLGIVTNPIVCVTG